jgi:hypothetical protein
MAGNNVFTLDSGYLTRKKQQLMNEIRYAEYKVGSTWHRTDIQTKKILADGRVEVVFVIDHTIAGNITVTGVRLLDYNGYLVGSKNTSITRADATEGISYTCRFRLFQVVENDSNTGAYDAL